MGAVEYYTTETSSDVPPDISELEAKYAIYCDRCGTFNVTIKTYHKSFKNNLFKLITLFISILLVGMGFLLIFYLLHPFNRENNFPILFLILFILGLIKHIGTVGRKKFSQEGDYLICHKCHREETKIDLNKNPLNKTSADLPIHFKTLTK